MSEDYCEKHDVDVETLNGYDRCPKCRMERERELEMAERATREPTVEPY